MCRSLIACEGKAWKFIAACAISPVLAATASAQSLAISIGVRETGQNVPIGTNGGTGGTGIEWINLDNQFLPFDSAWHQFTFNFGTDPVTSFTGDGALTGTRGTLEHIRFRNVGGITDNITMYVDDVVHTVSGSPTTFTGFESSETPSITVGQSEVIFRAPEFSGSTQSFIQPGSTSEVTDVQAHSGTQALRLKWTFVNGVTTNWVRDTTFNSPTYPNPSIDYSAGNSLSFWLRAEAIAPAQRWINPGSGNWDDSGNWGTGVVPNASNAVANFLSDITGAATVTLNNSITVNTVRLNSANSYTFAGSNTLTFSAPAESSMNINDELGSHTFTAPIILDSNAGTFGVMNFNVTRAADVLHITSDMTINNSVPLSVFKTGAGRAEIRKLESGADPTVAPLNLRVNGGTLKLVAGSGRTRVNELTMAGGTTPTAKLDITDNPLVVDYVPPATSPLVTIQAQVLAAYNAGAWNGNGISSSSANSSQFGVGIAEANALGSIPPVFGTVDDSAVLIRRTYYGDSDLNGQVDVADLGNLASHWQTNSVWSGGDFDYNGTVDVNDLGLLATNWQAGVGNPLGPESLGDALASLGLPSPSVPEPITAGLLVCAVLLLRRSTRSRAGIH
jgi:hypothetical protein